VAQGPPLPRTFSSAGRSAAMCSCRPGGRTLRWVGWWAVAAGCQLGDGGRFARQLTVSAMTAKAVPASFRSSCAAACAQATRRSPWPTSTRPGDRAPGLRAPPSAPSSAMSVADAGKAEEVSVPGPRHSAGLSGWCVCVTGTGKTGWMRPRALHLARKSHGEWAGGSTRRSAADPGPMVDMRLRAVGW